MHPRTGGVNMKKPEELKDNAAKAETVQAAGIKMTDEETADVNGGGFFDVIDALNDAGGARKHLVELANDIRKVLN